MDLKIEEIIETFEDYKEFGAESILLKYDHDTNLATISIKCTDESEPYGEESEPYYCSLEIYAKLVTSIANGLLMNRSTGEEYPIRVMFCETDGMGGRTIHT